MIWEYTNSYTRQNTNLIFFPKSTINYSGLRLHLLVKIIPQNLFRLMCEKLCTVFVHFLLNCPDCTLTVVTGTTTQDTMPMRESPGSPTRNAIKAQLLNVTRFRNCDVRFRSVAFELHFTFDGLNILRSRWYFVVLIKLK